MIAENTPSYYAIIPADVRYSKELCDGAKLLYGEITALCSKEGYCWASNGYFSKLYDKDAKTISRWVQELIEAQFIKSTIDKKAGNQRRLYLSPKVSIPILKSDDTPIPKNVEHSITVPNNKKKVISSKELELPIKERKTKFFNKINDWKAANPSKFPDGLYGMFFKYWTETNELEDASKMRFEGHTFFEIGKRLSTFWNNTKEAERSELWKQHEAAMPQLDLFNISKEKSFK